MRTIKKLLSKYWENYCKFYKPMLDAGVNPFTI